MTTEKGEKNEHYPLDLTQMHCDQLKQIWGILRQGTCKELKRKIQLLRL